MRIYLPLFACASVVAGLWLLRCVADGMTFGYRFLFLNIFLASVPLLLGLLFPVIRQRLKGALRTAACILTGFLWLLFIPNAFYILTDFMHLNSNVLVNMPGDTYRSAIEYARGDAMFMLDSLLIFCTVIFGGYAGGLALVQAYRYFRYKTGKGSALLLMSTIILLSSVGIFIGRFGRWNSWDALYQPWAIVGDLYQQLATPALSERFVVVVLTGIIFHLLSFWVVYHVARQSASTKPIA